MPPSVPFLGLLVGVAIINFVLCFLLEVSRLAPSVQKSEAYMYLYSNELSGMKFREKQLTKDYHVLMQFSLISYLSGEIQNITALSR